MKILSAEQIRDWDKYTIEHEPIASIDLMERAASQCLDWITRHIHPFSHFVIFCGKGNNGGDGLALARMLKGRSRNISVFIIDSGSPGTNDFNINLQRIQQSGIPINFIQSKDDFPAINDSQVIIDALFGSGLNRPLEGFLKDLVQHINNARAKTISIDIPSGLFCDDILIEGIAVKATHTLTFQAPKLSFFFKESETFVGELQVLDIGLNQEFLKAAATDFEVIDQSLAKKLIKPRSRYSHKGNFGHAAFIGGSRGMMGAAILASQACLRGGCGKLTCYVPGVGYEIMQISVPEAMTSASLNEGIDLQPYYSQKNHQAVCIGPGLGLGQESVQLIKDYLNSEHPPTVMDADALNILSQNPDLKGSIQPDFILTPHVGEFERLFGKSANSIEEISLLRKSSNALNCTIILKGHHTRIALSDGRVFFNSTGNPGMATGGSGDVLSGLITALLSQGHSTEEAAILGVFIHGLAGDLAAEQTGQHSLIAGDIIHYISDAFRFIAH